MPFSPGEEVDLKFITAQPAECELEFLGQRYTLTNLGLKSRRKGAMHALVRLPRETGKYAYTWTDGVNTESGHLRVRAAAPPRPAEQHEPAQGYTGPGSARRGRRGRP